MPGYAKQRSLWLDYPTTSTPILASNLNALETAVYDLKYLTFNVKDYGATGDGTTDDTAAVQAALTAATGVSGAIVFLPNGTYKVTSALSVPNFVQLHGTGQTSVVRCAGNHYALNLNPANRTRISNLYIDATSVQTSGGGIDFTNAEQNVWLDNIYFGNNLWISLNVKPVFASSGLFFFDRLRWNAVSGTGTAIALGNGTNLMTDVFFSNVLCTALTTTGITQVLSVLNNVDTLHMTDCVFYQGGGAIIGSNAVNTVSGARFTNVVFDALTGTGLTVNKCRDLGFDGCSIQTCSGVGLQVQLVCVDFQWRGGVIQNNGLSGVELYAGALYTKFLGTTINDNNTTNNAFGQGVSVGANANDFRLSDCVIGNGILAGHQKYGINVAAGTSTRYGWSGCTFMANETAPYTNAGTGASQVIGDNHPDVIPSVASATTTTLPGGPMVIVTGTTTITSVTAAQAGRVVVIQFSGILTFTDGSNLKLNGNFVTTADDTITLVSDGSNWVEVARSVN